MNIQKSEDVVSNRNLAVLEDVSLFYLREHPELLVPFLKKNIIMKRHSKNVNSVNAGFLNVFAIRPNFSDYYPQDSQLLIEFKENAVPYISVSASLESKSCITQIYDSTDAKNIFFSFYEVESQLT